MVIGRGVIIAILSMRAGMLSTAEEQSRLQPTYASGVGATQQFYRDSSATTPVLII